MSWPAYYPEYTLYMKSNGLFVAPNAANLSYLVSVPYIFTG
jgi:hypothetical protein